MDMDQKKLEKKLQEKMEANYRSYIQQLQNKPVSDLIGQAAEIAAVKLVYEELMEACSPDYAEYLIRFENPLELVSNYWLDEQNVAHSEEMGHVLWNIVDKGLGEGDYAIDEAYQPPTLNEGVRLC
ncbi:hypothetical protein BN3590_03761 [Clostridium sp. C105KSO15]|nr:hypothetical protein BN3590_03761 [Clostridium sp. C105KSO15]